MSYFDFLGKGVSKGWDAGSQGGLGQVGGLLGAIGGGAQSLFGGGSGNAQTDPNSLGGKFSNLGHELNAAQAYSDGDWNAGGQALGGMHPGMNPDEQHKALMRKLMMKGQY